MTPLSGDRDRRVDEALAEYLAGCDAGIPPDHTAFLAKYPDLADSLTEFLDDHARMRRAVGDVPATDEETVGTAVLPGGDVPHRSRQ